MGQTIEAVGAHPHFGGVPSFFRYLVLDAAHRMGGVYDYSICGCELARHAADLMEPSDEPRQDVDTRFGELQEAFTASDDEAVLAWFDREFPKCMALVPTRRRQKFLDGVHYAVEEGLI